MQAGQPEIEMLLHLWVQVRQVACVQGTADGTRVVFDAMGGRFEGPGLQGTVLASGGDWLTRSAAGSQLDVRLLLCTEDGIIIPFRYVGRASEREGQPRIEVAGQFEAPPGPYAWLNAVQAFGLGSASAEGVSYSFFRFK